MQKTAIGIINHCRKDYDISEILKNFDNVYVAYNYNLKNEELANNENIFIIPSENTTVAQVKNYIIAKAKEDKVEYLFLMDDDVIINDYKIIDEYCSLLNFSDCGVISCSVDKVINRALLGVNVASDNLGLTIKDRRFEFFSYLATNLILINLNKVDIVYDENLVYHEHLDFMKRLFIEKLIPFNSPYLDINNAIKSITFSDTISFRKKNNSEVIQAYRSEYAQVMEKYKDLEEPILDVEKIAAWIVSRFESEEAEKVVLA